MLNRIKSDQGGFALMMVVGAVILFIVLAATTAFMVSRLQKMSAGQARYTTATDAADGGIELGVLEISNAVNDGRQPQATQNVNIGRYTARIDISPQGTCAMPSGSLEMASAYEGIGTGAGSRGVANFFLVTATASAPPAPETGRLITMRRKLVGGE
ncbi:MAG TPA: hypothetical protein DDW31_06790 [candidate division Zixibacteria bacterium]|jgi:Tfp pilus assembly protein PilX|nr:hypothetical protein [candidate division Zixibacteria bacterium]